MRDKLEALGTYKINVPLHGSSKTDTVLTGSVSSEGNSINIYLFETEGFTDYHLANIMVNKNTSEVSVKVFPHIADFSPEYLKTALEETILSTDDSFLKDKLQEANQKSISEYRYSTQCLEHCAVVNPENISEHKDKVTLIINKGRLDIAPVNTINITDNIKTSDGNLIVYNDIESATIAANAITSYKNLSRNIHKQLIQLNTSPGLLEDATSLTDVADRINQGLVDLKELESSLEDLVDLQSVK